MVDEDFPPNCLRNSKELLRLVPKHTSSPVGHHSGNSQLNNIRFVIELAILRTLGSSFFIEAPSTGLTNPHLFKRNVNATRRVGDPQPLQISLAFLLNKCSYPSFTLPPRKYFPPSPDFPPHPGQWKFIDCPRREVLARSVPLDRS